MDHLLDLAVGTADLEGWAYCPGSTADVRMRLGLMVGANPWATRATPPRLATTLDHLERSAVLGIGGRLVRAQAASSISSQATGSGLIASTSR
jgi:hypothetical protein